MAQSKAELQREIRLLRKRVKEMEELLQQTAIKVEHLQGAYDVSVTDRAARKNLPKFELPPVANSLTTRWGRTDSTSQNKTKTSADEKAAANGVAKLIQQKTDEGYIERGK